MLQTTFGDPAMTAFGEQTTHRSSISVQQLQAALGDLDAPANVPGVEQSVLLKTAATSGAKQTVTTAVSVLKNGADDPVQLAADALSLGAQAVAANSTVAAPLSGSSQIISGVKKIAEGDAAGAALALATAGEKLASSSGIAGGFATVAGVMTLLRDKNVFIDKIKNTGHHLVAAVDTPQGEPKRLESAVKAGLGLREVAITTSSLGQTVVKISKNGLKTLGRVRLFSPTAKSLLVLGRGLAETPLGLALRGLQRWLPILNLTGVVFSGKVLADVFGESGSSQRSRLLAAGSFLTAGAAFALGFSGAVLPLLAVVGASIGLDFALEVSRGRDRRNNVDKAPSKDLGHRAITGTRHFGTA